MDKFNLNYKKSEAYSISEPLEPQRIFFVEDSRLLSNPQALDTATAILFYHWENGKPNYILQCTYFEKEDRFEYRISDFVDGFAENIKVVSNFFQDKRMLLWKQKTTKNENIHFLLKNALIERMNWINSSA